MATPTKYTKSIADDTANGVVEPGSLKTEIDASTIATALDYINTSGDDCDIWFKDVLRASATNTDGTATDSDETFTTTSSPFVAGDINEYITLTCAGDATVDGTYQITAVTDAQTLELDGLNCSGGGGATTWTLITDEDKLDTIVTAHQGTAVYHSEYAVTDGEHKILRVSAEAPESGIGVKFITPNLCDKTSWYYKSTKNTGIELTDAGAHTVYTSSDGPWVDNYHGKYFDEDYALTEDGFIPRLKIYVDDVLKTEQDPHTASGGDYTVDYSAGSITFLSALVGTETVTADYYKVDGFDTIIKPATGKEIKIIGSKIIHTDDVSVKDTIKFQLYIAGYPYGNPVTYKRMHDIYGEMKTPVCSMQVCNAATPTWRDLPNPVRTLEFPYQSLYYLKNSLTMDIRITLEHDAVFGGTWAVATLYGIIYDE